MGWKLDKTKLEWKAFKQEVVTVNGPRYKDPREWSSLIVDLPGAAFEHMHYTLAHIFWPMVAITVYVHV